MFSAKYDLNGSIKRTWSTGEVPQRTIWHLSTIVSQAKDGKIPCPVDRNLEIFLTSHIDFLFIFGQCADNSKLYLFLKRKVGVTERPRSLNPIKTLALAIFPIIFFVFLVLSARARCVTWHVDLRAQ